ncbi:MAG: hypothetical protein GY946_23095, partial [bacterium]|nr:hypothetical protein [bacterium]
GADLPVPSGVIGANAAVNAVAFSPDGTRLALGTTANVVEVRTRSGGLLATLIGHTMPLASVAFSPDGSVLASGSWDSTIRVWSMRDQREPTVLRGHVGRVNRVAFAPAGRPFSVADDHTLREWQPTIEPEIPVLRSAGRRVHAIAFLADGTLAVGAIDGGLRIMDPQTGDEVAVADARSGAEFAINPGRSTLAWIAGDSLWTWRAHSGTTEHKGPAEGHLLAGSNCVAMDDQRVVVLTEFGLTRLDLADSRWQKIGEVPGRSTTAGVPSQRPWYFARLGRNGHTLTGIWGNGGPITIENRGEQTVLDGEYLHAWDPLSTDGDFVVLLQSLRGDRSMTVYDTRTGKPEAELLGHLERVRAAAFSPDASRLASIGNDRTLRIWDFEHRREVLTLRYPVANEGGDARSRARFTAVAWSFDGKTVATGSSNGMVHRWVSERPRFR